MPLEIVSRRELLATLATFPIATSTPKAEALRGLFGQYADRVARADPSALAALFAPDAQYRDVTFATRLIGRDAIKNMFCRTFAALVSPRYGVEHAAFDGDTIAVRWELSGVHRGPLLGAPGSGRRIAVRGASFLTVRASQIAEQVDYLDRAGLERALGVRGARRD